MHGPDLSINRHEDSRFIHSSTGRQKQTQTIGLLESALITMAPAVSDSDYFSFNLDL